ncbi:DUF2490 domain-containing protein [uncultured Croceitalea sp.]|uniref:DUF2490 domain-containing protein n=1 Tax=uncultured Croceitalea sp. TaxID=1798908 RepID=UPI0033063DB6
MKKPKVTILIVVIFTLFLSTATMAQEDLKVWTGHSWSTNLTDEWRVRAGQLYLFDERFDLSSLQNNARVEYRFNRRFRVGLGYVRSSSPGDPDQQARNRLETRFRLSQRWGKLRIAHTLRPEWHFPERSKFEYRIRYSLGLHAGNWGLPLKITPYITNELHYYLDGRPFQYRDSAGDKLVRQSPNGLHAYRIRLGVRFRPFKRASANISFMRQREFNIGSPYRSLNVTDPRNGEVKRGFNNFSVLSFSFFYRIKMNGGSRTASIQNTRTSNL